MNSDERWQASRERLRRKLADLTDEPVPPMSPAEWAEFTDECMPWQSQIRRLSAELSRVQAANDELTKRYARLERQQDRDHQGFLASRRSICEQRDRYLAAIEDVKDLHSSYRRTAASDAYCVECGRDWPCPTFRHLSGAAVQPDQTEHVLSDPEEPNQ